MPKREVEFQRFDVKSHKLITQCDIFTILLLHISKIFREIKIQIVFNIS